LAKISMTKTDLSPRSLGKSGRLCRARTASRF
jgi:hypothetical protein